MASLTIPISVTQLLELTQQLSPEERRVLLNSLLVERFDAVLSQSDRQRGAGPDLTDEEIQLEIDSVRRNHRRDQNNAAGH
ncbi:MAG: hypothetical protein IT447_10160 [Phycisphaerales bacterium]|nr:hypothetical protein [Phycisphaerales bacterium]